MDVADRKVLVLGAGKSGVASAAFLIARGAVVALADRKPLDEWSVEARSLKSSGVGLVPGDLPAWLLDQIDLLVISPGIPVTSIPARYLDRAGAEVIGEVELAYRFMRGRIVGITGSNGKTTTTALIGEILRAGGLQVQVGGNIGTPLISLAESSVDAGWTVAELSSFQLETIAQFRAHVAIALNVTPNHMDRYELFRDYAAAKHRIFLNQLPEDVAILNADDELVASWSTGLRAQTVFVSVKRELEAGLFLRGRALICKHAGQEQVLTTRDDMNLVGLHNVQNVLAAMAAGIACGVPVAPMQGAVAAFQPVEHRLERVDQIGGVTFFNDSKATSVDATVKALEAVAEIEGQIVIILGGKGKQAPYAPLAELLRSKARCMVLIGADAPVIEQELAGVTKSLRAVDMHAAVQMAFAQAQPGDAVLLAPACASFDMYRSFEHRGQVFKQEVEVLRAQVSIAEA